MSTKITVTLTDEEVAALQSQITAPDVPTPELGPHVEALLRDTVLAPLLESQRKTRVAVIVGRLSAGGLLDKLAALPPDQQDQLQAEVALQVDSLLAAPVGLKTIAS